MNAKKSKPQEEDTERLMRVLAGSLVSWLTFQQSAKRSKMNGEHWMYAPIFEVALARGWKTIPQFPVKIGSTTKYPDFLFYRTSKPVKNNAIAALEISYIKEKTSPQKVSKDQEKLNKILDNQIFGGRHGAMRRYVMLVSDKEDLQQYCKANLPQALPLMKRAEYLERCSKGSVPKIKPKSEKELSKIGWIYCSPYPFRLRWWVMVLIVPSPP